MSQRKRKPPSKREKLVEAAVIWHAATVLNCQDERDSAADKMLRRACIRYLKASRQRASLRGATKSSPP